MRFGVVVVSLALGACGRLNFEPGGPGGTIDATGGGSGRRDALGTGIDGATDRPNVAFVTSATTTGVIGGVAGADAMCTAAATSAGLPGTFVAFLSSQAQDASDRLVGSRGWVRAGDGAPIADTAESMLAGAIFNGIDRDENGVKLAAQSFVWTGSTTVGGSVENCGEWTTTSLWGEFGFVGGAMPEMLRPYNVYTFSCGSLASVYCFEIGHAFEVTPAVTAGTRIAFLGTLAGHGGGVTGLDTQCQTEAGAAGLTGVFRAAVATQGNTIGSRFAPGAGWVRRDGTAISSSSSSMFDGSDPLSFVNQFADGTYVTAAGLVRTGGLPNVAGSSNTTCNSWTSTSNSNAQAGNKVTTAASMWSYVSFPCGGTAYTLCLQQ
jgi:hypothetical protein